MHKKLLALCLSVLLMLSIIPVASFASGEVRTCSVDFFDASSGAEIKAFGNKQNIYAKVKFTAPADGDAVIITAKYNADGSLQSSTSKKVEELAPGEVVECQTETITTSGVENIKIFVWDDMKTLVPAASNYGEIVRKTSSGSGGGGGGTSSGTDVSDGKTTAELVLSEENVSAVVPAGTKVESSSLKLSVTELVNSASGINAEENEILIPLDIHVEGIADDNTAPVIITITDTVSSGLNKGNLALYHVENGKTVKMEEVENLSDLVKHNQFHYEPLDGTITLAMATFSEVAVVEDTTGAWEGEFDYSWYDSSAKEYTIANADQLAAFGAIVGGMNGQTQDSFKDKTVILAADINLGDKDNANESLIFHPIGYYYTDDKNADGTKGDYYSTVNSFEGTFNGNGHTIANFYQNTWEIKGDYEGNYYSDAMGLFGYVVNGKIQNLTVDNFSSDGEFTPTGVISAYAVNSTFENIAITNCNPRVYNTGNGGIVGIGGNSDDPDDYKLTFTNITIDNTNKITALWGSWDVACGGLVGMFRGDGHVDMTNCHVAAQMDVYNDVCGNYQYYWYRYSGMMVGTNKNMTTDDKGYTVPETDKFHATNCTVHFGEWNDYYYCELVDNSLASYTHDHQFSRLTEISGLDEIKSGDTWTKTGNFLLISGNTKTCYHIVNKNGVLTQHNHEDAGEETVNGETVLKEDKTIVYLPFNQLFTGYGWGVKHIPVGEFNGVKILDREEANSVVKFEKTDTLKDSYMNNKEIQIGEFFKAVDDVTVDIVPENIQVTVSPVDENSTAGGTYTPNTTDWTQGTLTFSGIGAATITIQDYYFCTPTVITVNIEERQSEVKFESKFKGDFLYRVGNEEGSTVALGTLFEAKDNAKIETVSVEFETIAGNASGSYTGATTWTNGTIQFTGTGVVKVTITDNDYCIPTELILEVVDAYNRTTANFSGNSVLLNDVSTSSTLSTSGVVYGNGFTVNMETAPISEKNGAVFHLYDGAVLKNLGIVGKEFTTVAMNVNDTNYGVSAVRAWGTVTIENCYISGCRSAVSVTGTELTIKDSVIANGVYANIDFRSGILNLHNVTTINEPHTVNGTTVVGLGIVGNMTASAGRQINITGTLNQYNWVSQADCSNIKASGVDSIFKSVFTDGKYTSLRYTYNGTTYVNTGILSLCSDFGESSLTGAPDNYGGMDVTATISGVTVDGYVWAPAQAGTLTDTDMKYHDEIYKWSPSNQGTSFVAPAFGFANAGIEQDNGVVQISYESGSLYILTASALKELFKPQKYGKDLPYKVYMNGIDYTGKDIVLDATESNTYTITYAVTDNLVYDKMGQLTSNNYEVAKELKVFATVVDKGADAPTFTFYYGTNGSASAGTPHTTQPTNSYTSTIMQIGENYYIMPNVSATSANAIGSQTVDGETVYYPIVDGINVRSGNSTDYDFTRYYPIFKAVKISDNGTEYSYSSTKEMPATVSWVSATIDSGNGASSLNDGFGLYNNQYLCKIQKKAGDAESGGTSVIKYSYTALDGNTYYYYVGYRFYDEDEGRVCVTPDTLITLADGTQKRIDETTYNDKFLVWDFVNGKHTTAPASIIKNHGYDKYQVVTLNFADGTQVKTINGHGFFDKNENKFVILNKSNVKDYIGHSFVRNDKTTTKLVSYSIKEEYTESWSVLTAEHYNCILEDMLTLTPAEVDGSPEYLMPFAIDSDMKYDSKAMQNDIKKYGLYSYEDFADKLAYEQFVALNLKNFKVAVGKGKITYEDILYLINLHMH
ncbi:MAG: hypothetical protein E7406_06480 [Ruminococcaceae bacterium]|nr:hypothetical protein [Oscillospiraceae bacterium]